MWEECRRLLESRLLWLLFAGAMIVNLWIIWIFQGQAEYVEISRKLAESGVELLTEERQEEIIRAFDRADAAHLTQIPVRNMVEGALRLAEKLTASDLAESYVESMKLKGSAADYARKVYGTLSPVIRRNKEDGTARQFFVPCGGKFFELFSRWLPLALTLETVLTAALLMMKCVNEPFDQRTGAVIYATRTGRGINLRKGRAAAAVATGFTVIVWAAAFGAAGMVFPLGKLMGTGLGSMMILDLFYPLITRFSVSVSGYLGLQFLVDLGLVWLSGGIAYLAVVRIHKTITAFGLLALICFAVAVLTQIFPRNTVLYFVLRFNPVDFAQKAGRWFASGGTFLSARGYECLLLLFWSGVTAGLCHRQNHRFLREDL